MTVPERVVDTPAARLHAYLSAGVEDWFCRRRDADPAGSADGFTVAGSAVVDVRVVGTIADDSAAGCASGVWVLTPVTVSIVCQDPVSK